MTEEDPWQTPEGRRWRELANRELRPMIRNSAVTAMLWPASDEPDAKMAVELGFTLLLGKPLIILKPSGSNVPAHLARIAQAVVEFDHLDDTVMERLAAEVARIESEGA